MDYLPPSNSSEPYVPPIAPIREEIFDSDRDYWNAISGDPEEFQKYFEERLSKDGGNISLEITNSIIGEVGTVTVERLLSFMENVSLVQVDRDVGGFNRCATFPTVSIQLDGSKYAVYQSVTHCFDGLSSLSLDTIGGTNVTLNGELLRDTYLVVNRTDLRVPFDSALLLSPVRTPTFSSNWFEVRPNVGKDLLDELIREKVDIWQVGFPVSEQKALDIVRVARRLQVVRYESEGVTTRVHFSHVDGQVSTVMGDKGYSGGPLFYFNESGVPIIIATTYGVSYQIDSGNVLEIVGVNIIPEDDVVRFVNASDVDFMRLNWSLRLAGFGIVLDIDPIYSGSFNLSKIGADLVNRGGYDREQSERILTALTLAYFQISPDRVQVEISDSRFKLYVVVKLQQGEVERKIVYLSYNERGDVEARIVSESANRQTVMIGTPSK